MWVLVLVPALLGLSSAMICPDGDSCVNGNTCCRNLAGEDACCPVPRAECCSDHLHCCYERTVCDLVHGRCVNKTVSLPWTTRVAARPAPLAPQLQEKLKAVVCPDLESECPDGMTCCQLLDGSWGCCMFTKAVCCEDKRHCCPKGTACDLEHSRCVSSSQEFFPMQEKEPARRRENHWNECPDESVCPDMTTCCKLDDDTYGCCPMPNAICCSDRIHCCPEGTDCDVAHKACVNARRETAMTATLHAAVATLEEVGVVPCNGSVACADGNTCCKLPNEGWACCTLPKAVCCEDHLHCCPHGTVCNPEASTCEGASGAATPWSTKVPAVPSQAGNARCDQSTSCPRKSTCCKTESGGSACCPLPQAVCCDDHEHCCPAGYACNMAARSCNMAGALDRPWLRKVPALRREPSRPGPGPARPDRNMCDAQTSCPRDTTCCFMGESRRWGCCPLPKAVCCEDGLHCCPEGHACEPHRSACSRGSRMVVPWSSKLSARSEPAAVTDVKCDDKSSCASGTTCCKLQTGEWGCCPLVKAVCCADREHCCPQAYTCNMQTGTCEKTNADALHLPVPLIQVVRPEPGDSPCDVAGEFRCSARDTCCRLSAGEWACCPAHQAVCCPDSKHCCPAGHSCDPAAGGCSQRSQSSQLTWDAPLGDRRRDFVPRGL